MNYNTYLSTWEVMDDEIQRIFLMNRRNLEMEIL